MKLLTNQQAIIDISQEYRFWVILIPIASILSFIWDGIYIGLTESKQMRNSMLVAAFAVFFPVYFMSVSLLGNHALWLAFILFLFARGAAQTVIFKRKIRNNLDSLLP